MTPLRIAIAKGRIFKEVIPLLEAAGFDTADLRADSRRLIRTLGDGLEAMIVRSQDVPLFVEQGACTLGITGLDTLRERGAELWELLNLNLATCKLCIAGPRGIDFAADPTRHWRVATKYPKLTSQAFEAAGRYYELVVLGGTLETAPEAGVADCIVDLVDSGATLKAHELEIYQELLDVASYLVANPSGFYRQYEAVRDFVDRLADVVEQQD